MKLFKMRGVWVAALILAWIVAGGGARSDAKPPIKGPSNPRSPVSSSAGRGVRPAISVVNSRVSGSSGNRGGTTAQGARASQAGAGSGRSSSSGRGSLSATATMQQRLQDRLRQNEQNLSRNLAEIRNRSSALTQSRFSDSTRFSSGLSGGFNRPAEPCRSPSGAASIRPPMVRSGLTCVDGRIFGSSLSNHLRGFGTQRQACYQPVVRNLPRRPVTAYPPRLIEPNCDRLGGGVYFRGSSTQPSAVFGSGNCSSPLHAGWVRYHAGLIETYRPVDDVPETVVFASSTHAAPTAYYPEGDAVGIFDNPPNEAPLPGEVRPGPAPSHSSGQTADSSPLVSFTVITLGVDPIMDDGVEAFRNGDFFTARRRFSQLMIADARDPYARILYGLSWYAEGRDYEAAATAIYVALVQDSNILARPLDLLTLYEGDVYTLGTHFSRLESYVRHYPEDLAARFLLAYVLFSTEQPEEAAMALKSMRVEENKDDAVLTAFGKLLDELNAADRAGTEEGADREPSQTPQQPEQEGPPPPVEP